MESVIYQKPYQDHPYPAFYRGRCTQLISDLYPISKDYGRSKEMSELLPSLTSNDDVMSTNVDLTKRSINDRNGLTMLRICPDYLDRKDMDEKKQFDVGRMYQYLLDTDRKKWTSINILELTPEQLEDAYNELKSRLSDGYFWKRGMLIDVNFCWMELSLLSVKVISAEFLIVMVLIHIVILVIWES